MTKQEAYEQATFEELAKNPNGTIQEIVYNAMDIYASQFKHSFPVSDERWISVENKPEVGIKVLIYEPPYDLKNPLDYGNIQVSFYAGEKPKGEIRWDEWPDGQDDQPNSYCPSHWRPLPSKPNSK